MSFCNCCGNGQDVQVCSSCYTGMVWDANFASDYTGIDHARPISNYDFYNTSTPQNYNDFSGHIFRPVRFDNGNSDATNTGCNATNQGAGDCGEEFNECRLSGFSSHAYSLNSIPFGGFDGSHISGAKNGSYGFSAKNISGYNNPTGEVGGILTGIEEGSLLYNNSGIYGSVWNINSRMETDLSLFGDDYKRITITPGGAEANMYGVSPSVYGLFKLNLPSLLSGNYYKEYESTIQIERHGDDKFDNGQDIVSYRNGIGYTGTYTDLFSSTSFNNFSTYEFSPPSIDLKLTTAETFGNRVYISASTASFGPAIYPLGHLVTGDVSTSLGGESNPLLYGPSLNNMPLKIEGSVGTEAIDDIITDATFSDIKNNDFKLQISSSGLAPMTYDTGTEFYSGAFEVTIQIPELNYIRTVQTSGVIAKCEVGYASTAATQKIFGYNYIDPNPVDKFVVDGLVAPFIPNNHLLSIKYPYLGDPALGTGTGGNLTGYNFEGTHFSSDKTEDFATYIDDLNEDNHFATFSNGTPIATGATLRSGGLVGCIKRLRLDYDDILTPGLTLRRAEYYYNNINVSGITGGTGLQVLDARVDYNSYTIPNNEVMTLTGTPTDADDFLLIYENLGATGATITGIYITPSGSPTGILSSVDPVTGSVEPFQSKIFDFGLYSGLGDGDFSGTYSTVIETIHDSDGLIIDNPFYFSIVGNGTGTGGGGGGGPSGEGGP